MPESLTRAGLARFDEVAESHVGDDKVPGLVALVARGDEVHVKTHGSLAIGGAPVERDSLFRIASTSKPITGAATMALVGEGLIDLEEPVERLLPELASPRVLRRIDGPLDDTVPADGPITARQLLTFTFGFGMVVDMFMAAEPWPVVAAANGLHLATIGPPSPQEQPDPDTWIAGLGSLPLLAQPGERWMYNTGAQVLGVLLARAAGLSFSEVLRAQLFDPLGMSDTAFWAPDAGRLATAYMPTPEGLEICDAPGGAWSRPPAFGDGAAGLLSTADDLLRFAQMFLRGGQGIVTEAAVKEMTTNQLTPEQRARDAKGILDERGWGFCQSVITDGPRAGAFGWDGGLGTSWLVDPRRDLVVIVLTQRMFESPKPPPVHDELQDAAYSSLA